MLPLHVSAPECHLQGSSLLSVFVGQYTEYTNMHGISNIKLLHTHSFICHCHPLPALLNNTSKLWMLGTDRIQTRNRHIVSTIPDDMCISHLSSRYCDSCACAYHISRTGTATPAHVHITSLVQVLRLLHVKFVPHVCGTNVPWQMTSLPNRHFPSLRGQVYR
jgi:hypothetical protein